MSVQKHIRLFSIEDLPRLVEYCQISGNEALEKHHAS
jgi:hypothetical protein